MTRAHVAVELSGAGRHPAAWRLLPPAPDARPGVAPEQATLLDPRHHLRQAELAAAAGVDLVAIADSFTPPDADPAHLQVALDAVAVATRVAPAVPGLGLVPTVTTTHTEPFHLSKAIATLDFVTLGRAGVEIAVSRTEEEAALFGRKPAAPPEELWAEADEACEVIVRLWDSWEDDAVIRDAPTGRYVDRDKLHYIDFTGRFFSVKGPSITPRSPQAHPLVVVRADEPDALPVAARWADVVRVSAPDVATAHRVRHSVRGAVAAVGRDPDAVAVLWDVEYLPSARTLDELDAHEALAPASARIVGAAGELADLVAEAVAAGAADGVTAVPLALPGALDALADVTARLAERGVRSPVDPDTTLRERFGLPRPANMFEAAR